jgi:hypothetical protein
MADAERVFASATDSKRNAIKMIWPELYDALAGVETGRTSRFVTCVIGECPRKPAGERPVAVARLTRHGHPACADHITRLADRSGGWPLPYKDN